uniref:CRISPR system precrRNA processing endoribonuclease RAMP protein Cas6 n=1 Tax=candidate division WOR-3 bacterium TaxID=2052148 RepID=A0A7C6A8Q7_UNCW3
MKIAEFAIKLIAKDKLSLPPYKGSAIRGAFGYAFRKVSCPFPKKDCQECLLKEKCVYAFVFETPRPTTALVMRKYEKIPHPFLIEPPLATKTEYNPGDSLSFNLILFGKAIDFLPYFIYSFELMAEKGLGKGRGRLVVQSVNQGRNIIYDGVTKNLKGKTKEQELKIQQPRKSVKQIRLEFLTPLRIIYQGRLAQSLDFHILVRNLLRRIGLLSYFHSDQPFKIDFANLINQAMKVKTQMASFKTLDWVRYSSRQERLIKMDGIVGEVTYQGDLTQFIPYLEIGEKVHLGKGTTFGLGKFAFKILA